ncbi:Leucine-responsive regulatory protein [Brevundimonas diminuta]|jgi:Lrp/AsnC family leucine-responsive transcriptional regulator|uniref:ArsR family transcriptional regulator n=3 Tax=Brevundimonas TaxID=41275 RepID=A0A246KI34_BREDI|nr:MULTISPECIES: Lrp/AsnC ligand binding domain-containing protein [Brevundimonas]MBN9480484.1 Lrp/AsnC ligand binding domain-containing protein [Bordetella sp.]OJU55211.1 MAG: ArsR family transcriptional regulator [Brevundimonas sp. 67-6]ASD25964.1 ArsR family transcriptional regulator [Brevundimonas diminuta]EGF95230.1 leucine-responsive regulatory protein [Brevundimonas diminuta ATCC 11568]MBD3573170.1 winged helix-turn-helix transcriptional regulator [Brevundimonas diminuta]
MSAGEYKLDDADRRILRVLQQDGRITNQDLAAACNMSASSCFERVRRLRERGVITGYTALIDPKFAERELLIFIEVLLDRTTSDIFDQFAERIRRSPEVLECHMVAGGFDYLVKVRMKDMAAYRIFLADTLIVMPGVRETRTYAVMEEVKDTSVLPL